MEKAFVIKVNVPGYTGVKWHLWDKANENFSNGYLDVTPYIVKGTRDEVQIFATLCNNWLQKSGWENLKATIEQVELKKILIIN